MRRRWPSTSLLRPNRRSAALVVSATVSGLLSAAFTSPLKALRPKMSASSGSANIDAVLADLFAHAQAEVALRHPRHMAERRFRIPQGGAEDIGHRAEPVVVATGDVALEFQAHDPVGPRHAGVRQPAVIEQQGDQIGRGDGHGQAQHHHQGVGRFGQQLAPADAQVFEFHESPFRPELENFCSERLSG